MGTDESTVAATTVSLDAGHEEASDFALLEYLAEQTEDTALKRELEASAANGRVSSLGLRNTWDRLWMAFVVGR